MNIPAYTTFDGLTNNSIVNVVETPDKSIYFFSDKGESICRLTNGIIKKIANLQVGPSYVAHDGSLWMGQNALLIQIKNRQMKRYDEQTGLPLKWISAITEDEKSLIIYIDHMGIFRFKDGHLSPYLLRGGKRFPADEYVFCFHRQGKNIL